MKSPCAEQVDPLWYNRLMIELQSEMEEPIDPDSTRLPFNQVVRLTSTWSFATQLAIQI